jgi:hypothetical protein
VSIWRACGWTAVIVANWLLIGYTVLRIRRDLAGGRVTRSSWLFPAPTFEPGPRYDDGDAALVPSVPDATAVSLAGTRRTG